MDSPLAKLRSAGFEIESLNHAEAILRHDIPGALQDLQDVLANFEIRVSELVVGGGGESSITQRLRKAFQERNWNEHQFLIERRVDGVERVSLYHRVDHVKVFGDYTVACEIEWNNKDPFFDRDLETFRRLHEDRAISVGMIITRGESFQGNLVSMLTEFANRTKVCRKADLKRFGIKLTKRQMQNLRRRIASSEMKAFSQAWAEMFVGDKFGEATTHWRKLQERINRGLGNPCPLLLIGLPSSIVKDT